MRKELYMRTPWRTCGCGKCGLIWALEDDFCVAEARRGGDLEDEISEERRQANAARIAAAINACVGFDTEQLQKMSPGELLKLWVDAKLKSGAAPHAPLLTRKPPHD